MSGAHARLAPSSAHRWSLCPAAPKMEAEFGDMAGYEAAEGTVFHHFAAEALETGKDPDEFVGRKLRQKWLGKDGKVEAGEIEFTNEMANDMRHGLDLVRMWADDPSTKLYVERRVDLSWVLGEKAFGTADIILVGGMRLVVADWKYGAGVPVAPMNNEQLILYALGAWNEFATDEMKSSPGRATVELHIFQPRCAGGGGGWMISGEELLKWADRLSEAAEKTREEDPEAVPGHKQCLFCSAAKANSCKAREEFLLDLVNADLDEINDEITFAGESRRDVTPEMRSEILRNRKMIEKWLDQLHREAIDDALSGKPVPGLKLAKGRKGPRHIPVSQHGDVIPLAEAFLGDEAFVTKLDSLGNLEKKFGKDVVDEVLGEFIRQQPPRPILVPEDDEKHEPWPIADDYFNDEDVNGEMQ